MNNFEYIYSLFEKYSFTLDYEKYMQFNKYAEFLIEYNKKVNLTAITNLKEIFVKHFIDSVLLLKYIDIPENSKIIDVGTGAGFPSVPMKIMRPDLKITLLDSLDKRINFLEQLTNILKIDAECIHGRAEIIAKLPEYREKFDFSCARAVANLSVLSEYCIPFVKVGGSILAMKGPSEDVNNAIEAIKILGGKIDKIHNYMLENEKRIIIDIKKFTSTPTKFPRNSNQIKKKNL